MSFLEESMAVQEDKIARLALSDRNDGSLALYEQLKAANIKPTIELINKMLEGGITIDQLNLPSDTATRSTPVEAVIWP